MHKARYLSVAVVCSAWLIWGVSPALAAPCTSYEPEPFTPVASVIPFAGDGQSAALSAAFATALKVQVLGPCGELLSGLTVTFTAPLSGASATFPNGASAVTDANGFATVNASANGTAGTYQVTASTAGIPGVFGLTNIQSAQTAQTIGFGALGGRSYGAASFGLSAIATSGLTVSFASTTSSVCTVSGTTLTIVAAGPCSITASQSGDATHSAAPNVIQGFMVSKAALIVTAQNATITYPAAAPAFSASITGFVDGDLSTVVTGSPAFSNNAAITNGKPNAGTWIITPSAGSLAASNYTFSFATGALTVSQAPLSITASGQTISYGTAANLVAGAGTITVTGLVNGDSGTPGLSTNAIVSFTFPNAGTWSIIPAVGTIPPGNYNITVNNGTLTVNKLAISVTAKPQTITYGNMANLTAGPGTVAVATLVAGDTGAPSLSTNATLTNGNANATNGTPWTITPSAGTISTSNYTITFNNGSLTVNRSELTVTATNAGKAYGSTFAPTAFTMSGLLSGDSVSTVTLSSSGAAGAATVAGSPYSIVPSAAVGTALANYAISYVNGALTVNRAALTVVANNASRAYGAVNPTLSAVIAGFVNGETSAVVTGAPALSTTAGPLSSGGAYPITPAVGTLSAANYTFGFVNGTLTVTAAALAAPASSISLTSSVNPSTLGQSVTFTVSVTTSGPPGSPSGSVQFFDGAKLLANVLLSGASASYATSTLAGGSHNIVAQYSGDSTFPQAQASYGQFVTAAAATLSLTAAPAASVYGQPVVLTATVAPATTPPGVALPIGQVSFSVGGTATLASGTTSVTVTTLSVGTDSITAQYNGDSTWPSASGAISLTVSPAFTAAALSLKMVSGQLALVAAIAPVAPGAGIATGIVQFVNTSNNTMVASAGLSSGNATANVSTSVIGLPIVAVYGGDANFKGSTSATLPTAFNAATDLSTVFAPDEVASLFNVIGLSGNTSGPLPLTTSLGGVTVTVTDSAGVARQAQLYGVFGSAGQINFVVPSATGSGPATVTITVPGSATVTTMIQVAAAAPGIFTPNMNGQGAYAGQVVYASPDGSQLIASSAVMDPATNQYVPNPISLSTPGQQVYLVLYGTGIRHAASLTAAINGVNLPVFFFGAQGQYPGLDQINLQVPGILAGSGLVNLVVTMGGQAANTVTVFLE